MKNPKGRKFKRLSGGPTNQQQIYTRDDAGRMTRFAIETSNTYEPLENMEHDQTEVQEPVHSDKKVRLPPITVKQLDKKKFTATMKQLEITDYRIRMTSMGTNIFVSQVEHHRKVREELKKSEILFFSHDLPDDKCVKVVVKGLDKMTHEELKEHLKECGVSPLDIRTITPKQSRYTDQANYVLFFRKDGFAMKDLQQIRAVNHTIVSWEYYRKQQSGPTQCRRCLQLGHGTRHCHLEPRCKYCAEGHLSDNCPAIKEALEATEKGQPETQSKDQLWKVKFTPKCCNCDEPHVATDTRCKKKEEFLLMQQRLASKNRRQQQRSVLPRHESFPPLQPVHQQVDRLPIRQRSNLMSYSQAATRAPAQRPGDFAFPSTQPLPRLSNPANDSELFTFQEINSLLRELVSGLSTCKNKLEQFQVVTNLAIKYLYDGLP